MKKAKGAVFVLRDKEERILLQHRDEKTSRYPNHWGFFGGELKGNENPEEAVRREAKEELEIDLKNLKLFKSFKLKDKYGFMRNEFLFIASLDFSLNGLKERQKEGNDLGFFSFEDLKKIKLIDFQKTMLEDLFGNRF